MFNHQVLNISHSETLKPSILTLSPNNYLKSTSPSPFFSSQMPSKLSKRNCSKLLQLPLTVFSVLVCFVLFFFPDLEGCIPTFKYPIFPLSDSTFQIVSCRRMSSADLQGTMAALHQEWEMDFPYGCWKGH